MTDFKDTAMGYPTSLVPTGTWPLDSRSYFEDKLSADAAAAKAEEASRIGTSMYYIGQPITVYDKTDGSVKLYYIGEDKALHQIEDAEKAKQVADYLSNAISSKIFVRNFDEDGNEVGAYTDLSVVKIDKDAYDLGVIGDTLLSNVLYILQANYVDAYGQQLKNLASPTELSDATPKKYVDDKVTVAREDLSDYVDEQVTAAREDLSGYVDTCVASAREDLSDYVDEQVTAARTDLSNYVKDTVNAVSTDLNGNLASISVAVDKKINIDGLSTDQLSLLNIDLHDYIQMLSNDLVLSNQLYVVSSDFIDAYGQQIKNVANPIELSDATNKGYVDDKFDKVKVALADALTVSIEETSNLSTTINAVVSLRNILTALYTAL